MARLLGLSLNGWPVRTASAAQVFEWRDRLSPSANLAKSIQVRILTDCPDVWLPADCPDAWLSRAVTALFIVLESRPDARFCSATAIAFSSAAPKATTELCFDEALSIQSAAPVELEEAADCSQLLLAVIAFSQLAVALEIPDIVLFLFSAPLFQTYAMTVNELQPPNITPEERKPETRPCSTAKAFFRSDVHIKRRS